MAQWDHQKLINQRSRVRIQVVIVLLLFINNLINDKSKHNKEQMLLFVLYCPRPFTVMYNMYKSMTSRGVHLYPIFVLY